MILASAGSGKTFALTDRYVALLAAGAEPERIAALTFTRKAAGEFFDEILRKLAGAAADPGVAAGLAGRVEFRELGTGDFVRMLRSVVDSMHRLNLGTLDSFFARIVRAFPLELGLGGDFEILSEQAARIERRRALRELFAAAGRLTDESRREFIEAFKRATFGLEEKNLGRRLDRFIDENLEYFLAAPDPEVWGRAGSIWPGGGPWPAAAAGRGDAAREFEGLLAWESLTEKQAVRWRAFFDKLPGWQPGAPLPPAVSYILGNVLDAWPDLLEFTVERRKLALRAKGRDALRRLVSAVVGSELVRRLEMTRGLFEVLRAFESVYDESVRRTGRLTFADLQRLLQPDGPMHAPPLSQRADGDARLYIDWRLDARIDHWLLDEFQDTSQVQWSVLRNLIDEAVQDPGGTRSFFYVGDAKQAIYNWRGGDSRLFREIFRHYNGGGSETIREKRLDRSWRSGPAVVGMVNRVFGAKEALRALFPGSASARWTEEWAEHASARPEMTGWAELLAADDRDARFAATLRILLDTKPLERGLEAAVLVRTNDTAAELAEYLRSEGKLRAVAESDLRVGSDNPLACAILALFRAAAHPGDRGAWGHVTMTPVMAVLRDQGLVTQDEISSRLLAEIHTHGFERTVDRWLALLEPKLGANDKFSRERGRQLAAAGRQFDATGSRSPAEFARYAGDYTVREADSAAVIRVMTVHKAKGLGFDMVILPDLEGQKLAKRRDGLALHRGADRTVRWVLDYPGEDFWRPDPVLSAHAAEAESDACYENLCLLYVAMTRAKRALYVITETVGKSASLNFPRLLQETLGEIWSDGDPLWHEKSSPIREDPAAEAALAQVAAPAARAPRRAARRPSALRAGVTIAAAPLFALGTRSASDLGSAVHALLAEVEWIGGPSDSDRFEAAWGVRHPDPEAVSLSIASLRRADSGRIWARPAGNAELWRERSFEAVLDGAWVTGVFDRVIVRRDARGAATSAAVFDFKTDATEGTAGLAAASARHAPQLELYRRAAALLAGIDFAAVTAEPVFLTSAPPKF